MREMTALILAAGQGTRMKSRKAKVLHRVGGLPMLEFVVRAAREIVDDVRIVVGHQAQDVMDSVEGVGFVHQQERLGTGHAVMVARESLGRKDGALLILPGDVPLISADLLRDFVKFYQEGGFSGAVLTATLEDPAGYGRVIRRSEHEIDRIIEDRDATAEVRSVREVNSAICIFERQALFQALDRLSTENAQAEYYLTDVVAIFSEDGRRVGAFEAEDPTETTGINSRRELARVDGLLRRRKCERLMRDGVSILDPASAWIDADVKIGLDSVVYPSVSLEGQTELGEDVTIRSYSRISDSSVGHRSVVLEGCVIENSEIHSEVRLGPCAHLRPGVVLEDRVKVGNFVEIKKSRMGQGSKAMHLSYVGDADVGNDVNVGAGTITCNYDGLNKARTIVEDGAFIGSDSQLIAPVRIGRGAYVAAGSTIDADVPADALAIARGRQVVKKDWAKKRKKRTKKN